MMCVLSKAEKEEFEELLPELQGRVSIVKNIIADHFFHAKRIESHEPLVLFASRFLEKKGPFHLLKAVPSIVARVPSTRFVFLGDGPDAAAFDVEVEKRDVRKYVRRVAHAGREEMSDWHSRAWVFVFPTMFPEGMPMVIAEALAAGTPIVTTRTRFAASYMIEFENCLYCEKQQPGSIATQVITLLTDSELRAHMSQANRTLALQFRADPVAREFVRLYEKLADAPKMVRAATVV